MKPNSAADGAAILDDVEVFLARFIAYPSSAARVAHALWIAHTHAMGRWESTPRIAFLSPEPSSGKSRALEVTELCVPNPVHAVNVSPAYLFRKIGDEAGAPTVLFDEIDTVFGPKARENEDVRGLLNAGHRKGAVAGRAKVVGKTVMTEELPAYCAVALAGLNDLPDTLMSRSVPIRMRRRAPSEMVEPFRHRLHEAEGHALRDRLAAWAATIPDGVWPDMPAEIADRNADIWEALLAVADHAGGDWPERARCDAVTLVTDVRADAQSLGIRLLEDLRIVFGDEDVMFTEEIISALVGMEESPWGDLRGQPIDARWLARRLGRYGDIAPKTVRKTERTAKGYLRANLADTWTRYAPPAPAPVEASQASHPSQADTLDLSPPGATDVPHLVANGNGQPAGPKDDDEATVAIPTDDDDAAFHAAMAETFGESTVTA